VRVLLITSAYPSDARDPRGTFIHTLARALASEGLEVTVLAPGTRWGPSTETRDGIKVQRARYWIRRWQSLAEGVGGIVPNLRRRPLLVAQVIPLFVALTWRAIRMASGFDVIHAHWLFPGGIAGLAAAKIHRVPFVVTSHGGDLNLSRHSALLRLVTNAVSAGADACVGVSHAMVEEFVRQGTPASKVTFIPLGLESAEDSPKAQQVPHPELDRYRDYQGLRIVYVGSLIARKSVHVLLKAHRELARRGRPAESESLPDVFFAGAQSPTEALTMMTYADVLVLPSLSEGRGLVLVEAMSLGLPVIASDIPGPRELVKEEVTGMLFPVGDATALANCLERLISIPGLGPALGEGGRRLVESEHLTARECARQHVALYHRMRASL
jgi:glycosyltransferase involved in cell wall biosynthesis